MNRISALVCCGISLIAGQGFAADNLVGHAISMTKYGGSPVEGRGFKISIKAAQNGNPTEFPLPNDPISNGGAVIVRRDGGTLYDTLTAGSWKGLGTPPGSKGWKYKNSSAPVGGEVKTLKITSKGIRITTKGAGTMPIPASPNGAIDFIFVADDQRFCAQASAPHATEIDGKLIKTEGQSAPVTCAPACVVGVDSDGDRLDNCYETDTGVYVSPTDTGTDLLTADTDGDGIGDGDEILGTLAGLDLPGLGLSPLRKEILMEYDWFDDASECAFHSHEPTPASLALVTAAFASAPVTSPDGSSGITIIHDYGQGGLFTGGNYIADADGNLVGSDDDTEFLTYKASNFAANRAGYFHYTILPHRYDVNSGSSGHAEIRGDDLIVSLYCAHSDMNVGHTIMHELGHNLGLLHGGDQACNYKPNYNSVMNYRYQFPGVDNDCDPPGDGVLDYSIGDRIPLDENNLDETAGTCGAPSWDWNSNAMIEMGVALNINPGDPLEALVCGGLQTNLSDHDDWANLYFGGVSDFDGAAVYRETITCDNPAPMP